MAVYHPESAMPICPRCHSENPAAARFCMNCGSALARAEPAAAGPEVRGRVASGENRVVTVLFLDIAGSTRLSEALGAEPWHHLLSAFFAAITRVIEQAGGTVNQYTGDGLMALFGAPVALEDHALRACHAALDGQRRIQELADRVRLEHGLNFGVRIGLNTGPVVVGAIADDWRRDYTAQGATVHLAARMEQMAQPGSVFLSASTARLVQGYFALRSIGPTRVAGIAEPVAVAELTGVGPLRQRLERSRHVGLSPFVGREPLQQALRAARAEAQAGCSRVVILRGEAGLGKSRLCLELLERWRLEGAGTAQILQCAAVSHGDAQPLAPVRAMLRQWLGVSRAEPADSARRTVAGSVMLDYPELRDLLPALFEFLDIAPAGPAGSLAPDAQQRRQKALQERLCRCLCREDLVLWIDDWHWLDAASRAYLQDWIAHLQADARALILLTTRPQPLPAWLVQAPTQIVDLQPLDGEAMRELAGRLAGPWFPEHPLGQQVVAHAEGNPYFVEESITHLVDRGVLHGPVGGRVLARENEDWRVPDTVQALLAARLDSVPAADRRLLEAAALIGREFAAEWICALHEATPEVVRAALYRLADGGFVEPLPGEQLWRFSHGLLQEEAVQRQLDSQRRQRWKQLAQWLCSQIDAGALPATTWLRVAGYQARAGEVAAAVESNLQGSRAVGRLSLHDSMRVARDALAQAESLPAGPEREALRFKVHASLLRGASFGLEDAADVAHWTAEAEAHLAREPEPRAQVELWMSTGALALNQGLVRPAFRRVGRAFALARQVDDPTLLGRFRVPLLFTHLMRGAVDRGLRLLDERDGGAWRDGPPHLDNFLSRGFRGAMLAAGGEHEAGVEELQRVVRFAEDADAPVSWMYGYLAELMLPDHGAAAVEPLARRGVDVARDFGSPAFDEIAHRALALVIADTGATRDALQMLQQWTPQVGKGRPGGVFAAAHHESLARLAWAAGEKDVAAQAITHAVQLAREQGQLYWLARALQTRLALFPDVSHRGRDQVWIARLIRVTGARSLRSPPWLPNV